MKTIYIFILSFILVVCGCEPKVTTEDIEHASYIPIARKCNYAWAFNAYAEEHIGPQGYHYTQRYPLRKDTVLKASNYVLGFSTCNVGTQELKQKERFKEYAERLERGEVDMMTIPPFGILPWADKMTDDSDPIIETRLKQQLESPKTRTVSSDLPTTVLIRVDYRLTWLKDIKITCSAEIAGRAAGQSLTDLFAVQGYYEHHDFIVTSNKNVITDKARIKGISLSQYLSYKPMAPAEIFLRFKEGVNVSAPVTAQFTVELITGEDKSIKTTAAAVNFVP